VYPCQIYGLATYALKNTMSCGMGEAQFGEEKMSKAILKDGMTTQAKHQVLKPQLAQDFNQTQWQSKDNFEMMLENECSCTFFKVISWRQFFGWSFLKVLMEDWITNKSP